MSDKRRNCIPVDSVTIRVDRPTFAPAPTEVVDHPAHYNALPAKCLGCGRPIECIDVVEHLGFSLGNAIKYVWRAPFKGRTLEDLKKAAWYLAREIERLTKAGAP